MAQQVETATVPTTEVKTTINALANGYDDVLNVTQATDGYMLIIHKPQV